MVKPMSFGAACCAVALAACSPSGPPVHVSAVDLYAAYLRNAPAADEQYRGHRLIVDGVSGGIDSEPDGYALTLMPGVRVHLDATTGGTNLFQQVAVQCDDVTFVDAVLNLAGCTILESLGPSKATGSGSSSALEELPATSDNPVPDRLSAAFEAATGHQTAFKATEEDGEFTVTPLELIQLPFGVALLTERKQKDGCHACEGAVGISYLSEHNGKFSVLRNWPRAIEGSGFGHPPKWHITKEFTRYPAIYAETSYMFHGDRGETVSLVELQPSGPMTSDPISTAGSNEGTIEGNYPPPCIYTGHIADVQKDQSFDVRFSGSMTGKEHYVKRGGKFVAVTEADSGPECKSGAS
jgi:hypothetical protein